MLLTRVDIWYFQGSGQGGTGMALVIESLPFIFIFDGTP